MKRYATVDNPQATLREEGQRAKITNNNIKNKVNKDLGVANFSRLNSQFNNGIFKDYVPLNIFDVDSFHLQGNPDFSENISLNYTKNLLERSYDLEDTIKSVNDVPQRGAPNINVSNEDMENPDNIRQESLLPKRSTAFGVQYKINNNDNVGITKRQKMSSYITSGTPIHRGGTKNRLGTSDPEGRPYEIYKRDNPEDIDNQPSIPSVKERNDLLDRRKLEHARADLNPAPGQPPRPPSPLPDL